MAALTVFCGLVNSLPTSWMEKLTRTYVIFHVLVLVTCSIALLAKTENKHDAKYVFTDTTGVSGWTPSGFAWLFGFLSVSWTMTDYDATAHITEEYGFWALQSLMYLLTAVESPNQKSRHLLQFSGPWLLPMLSVFSSTLSSPFAWAIQTIFSYLPLAKSLLKS